ncbi:hypothetical protein [Micromonospora sp. NPDC047730]|uniref:hypothetical protein n=1 Tax=Micromonospora sp. NPDC047730 TaxID=3364253 RepID=UPI003718B364
MSMTDADRVVLAIVGSVSFVDVTALDVAAEIVEGTFARRRPDVVVSGGADGIDTLGVVLAKKHGIPYREYLPKVRRWSGPGGFQERNLLVAGDCTRILRIACRWSKTYGSGWTTDQAEKRGATAWRVILPRTVERGTLQARLRHEEVVSARVEGGKVVEVTPHGGPERWAGRHVDDLVRELQAGRLPVRWIPAPPRRPRPWPQVRAEMGLDEQRVGVHRKQMLAEVEEFRRHEERGGQHG